MFNVLKMGSKVPVVTTTGTFGARDPANKLVVFELANYGLSIAA